MTTIKTFRCDLCRDQIKPSEHAQKEGFGINFLPGGASEFRRLADCAHHICLQCAKSVHDELRKATST